MLSWLQILTLSWSTHLQPATINHHHTHDRDIIHLQLWWGTTSFRNHSHKFSLKKNFIISNELLYQNGQKKYVQLHLNPNKFGWLFLNQWFGLHMKWLFPNDVSTTPTSSRSLLPANVQTHKKVFPNIYLQEIINVLINKLDQTHFLLCYTLWLESVLQVELLVIYLQLPYLPCHEQLFSNREESVTIKFRWWIHWY